MGGEREKQPDIVYIQRDLEAIKHTLDTVLRPFKDEVRGLRALNLSLKAGAARREAEVELLLQLIVRRCPDAFDDALSLLLDPKRRGWKTFRSNWLRRLGLERLCPPIPHPVRIAGHANELAGSRE